MPPGLEKAPPPRLQPSPLDESCLGPWTHLCHRAGMPGSLAGWKPATTTEPPLARRKSRTAVALTVWHSEQRLIPSARQKSVLSPSSHLQVQPGNIFRGQLDIDASEAAGGLGNRAGSDEGERRERLVQHVGKLSGPYQQRTSSGSDHLRSPARSVKKPRAWLDQAKWAAPDS